MFIKQLSVFAENQKGRLAEIVDTIGQAGIDIRAMSVADTADFGILRLIVDRPNDALNVLREKGLTVSLTDVIGVGIADKPGSFAEVLNFLCGTGVSVEYMYAFISREEGNAYVILRVDNNELALDVFEKTGVQILDPQKVYNM